MADQLRADYLGCTGHPTIRTPVIDTLAEDGVSFGRAYCQAPVCGPSRMSFYTGRYASSHGATYNNVPLRADERTLGDYLRPLGYRVALVGKTHMKADVEGMRRLGIDPNSSRGVEIRECGFEPYERDDGLHPAQLADPDLAYNRWLRQLGYGGDNPWHDWANAAEGENGELLSGWYMRNANLPARVREEHSETAYMTDRAMDFIDRAGDEPWCLHLSYIKPHWPYMAPAPYHDMYGAGDIIEANRSEAELADQHPVLAAFRRHGESVSFSREETRRTVIPTYMGLTTQIDTHLGRLFDHMRERGLWERTLIVFTSDHGDYLGDHWLGEKDLFHEEAVRIPLILRAPEAIGDAVRGAKSDALVEAIDLIPTFIELAGGEVPDHVLEGRSLRPFLEGAEAADWREFVVSEEDYSFLKARLDLGLAADEGRAIMLRTARWKYVHHLKFPPELYDLEADPKELRDLGRDPAHEGVRAEFRDRLVNWFAGRRVRTTISNAEVDLKAGRAAERGFIIGEW
jgi:arylsulfatase A-like enzyme